jgi:hypothetical protein
LAFNSNDDEAGGPGGVPPEELRQSAPAPTESAGFVRFASCRWQQPAEEGNPAFCTHREVKPLAGTTSFDPNAWCVDCQYYKLRRMPKKRAPEAGW